MKPLLTFGLILQLILAPFGLRAKEDFSSFYLTQADLDSHLKKSTQEFAQRSQTGRKWVFKEIPRDLGLSLKESFWGWGTLGFAAGTGLTAFSHRWDDDIQNKLGPNQIFSQTGNDVLKWTTSPYTVGGISLITWIVAHNTQHPKLALTARATTEAWFLSMSVTALTKVAFRRERPNGGNFSFPSGHTTSAFSTAAVLTTFYGWKGALPGYTFALLTTLNRLDSHDHFFSDVLMGAVIGTVIGVGTARFHKKQNPHFFVVPRVNDEQISLNLFYRF